MCSFYRLTGGMAARKRAENVLPPTALTAQMKRLNRQPGEQVRTLSEALRRLLPSSCLKASANAPVSMLLAASMAERCRPMALSGDWKQ